MPAGVGGFVGFAGFAGFAGSVEYGTGQMTTVAAEVSSATAGRVRVRKGGN